MLNISVLVPPEILGYIFKLLIVPPRLYSVGPFSDQEIGWKRDVTTSSSFVTTLD